MLIQKLHQCCKLSIIDLETYTVMILFQSYRFCNQFMPSSGNSNAVRHISLCIFLLVRHKNTLKYARDNNWSRKNDIRRGSNEDMNQDPSFAYLSETKIRANIGSTITFNCRVLNAKQHTVSKCIQAVDVYLIFYIGPYL